MEPNSIRAQEINDLSKKLDQFRLAQQKLKLCLKLWSGAAIYLFVTHPPTEADALAQLLKSIDEIIRL